MSFEAGLVFETAERLFERSFTPSQMKDAERGEWLAAEWLGAPDDASAVMANILLSAPGSSLRGGTREILGGILVRGLGLR